MPGFPERKPLRLKGYDYSKEGFYFLTICTKDRECILSQIVLDTQGGASVALTEYGRIAESYIKTMPGIHQYVVMPNHVHLIIHKTNGKSIENDVRSLKTLVTKKIGKKIWQDNYYDHIIRDEEDFLTKAEYIQANPARWADDPEKP